VTRRPLDHIVWLAQYGGGDQLADANCWRDVKPWLPDLLPVVRAAQAALDDIAVATVVLEQDGYAKESMFLHQHHARLAAALAAFEDGGKP
jgi:hypothetical protein